MNSQSEQNGRSTTLPSVSSRDPRLRNISSSEPQVEVCRDYVWGICNKHGQCRFRHDCTIEEMKSIINFCHDYQNRQGCMLPNCTYLHTSRDEENLFRTTGQLPRVLLERHAAMNAAAAAAANNNAHCMEGVPPPIFMAQPPPPPPPLVTVPPPLPITPVMPPPPPPPPPPPLPLPSTEPSTVAQPHIASQMYTAPPPQATPVVPLNQPPPLLPLFDASRPPPNMANGAVKRPFSDVSSEAGASKRRRTDDLQGADSMCEKCVQREISSDLCLVELEKLNKQKEYKNYLYKCKSEEIENRKTMMRFLLPTEICLAVEEYVDQGVQSPPPLAMSTTMQLMMHRLLEDRLTSSNNMMESIPSTSSSSMRDTLLGYILNSSSTADCLSPPEPRSNPILCQEIPRSTTSNLPTTSNGLSRLLNGQSVAKPQPEPSVSLHNRASGSSTSSSAAYPVYQPGVPPPLTPLAAYPTYPSVPPPAYPPYQPAMPPPPPRSYLTSYADTGSLTPAAFQGSSRVPSGPPPGPAPVPTPVPAPGHAPGHPPGHPSGHAPGRAPPHAPATAPPHARSQHNTYNQYMPSGYQ